MKEITLDTKISELLNDFDGMKDILIDINPKFKKLNNPILRRTIAKLAGVKQAAIVGGMKPVELLNRLREAVGQEKILYAVDSELNDKNMSNPLWIKGNIKTVLDANEILDKDLNPLVELYKSTQEIQKNEVILIKSDFQPEPLIEEYRKKSYEVYCQKVDKDTFFTYIKR